MVSILCLLDGCSLPWPNPNIGERTADIANYMGKHEKELATLHSHAREPWAQLRLGMVYEYGDGVETNYTKALEWYLRAALQHGKGRWAEGEFLAVGKRGYYGVNYDAGNAQLRIARMYETGKGVKTNLLEASLWAQHSLKMVKAKQVKFTDGKLVSQEIERIVILMTHEQKAQFENRKESWSPLKSELLLLMYTGNNGK